MEDSGDPQNMNVNMNLDMGMFLSQEFLKKDGDNSLQLVDIAENSLGEDNSSSYQWQLGGGNPTTAQQPQQDIEDLMFRETFEDPFLATGSTDPMANAADGQPALGSVQTGGGVHDFDESPPFTIELDMFFDPMAIDDDVNSKQTPQSVFVDYNTPQLTQFDQHLILLLLYQHQQRQNPQPQLQNQGQMQLPTSGQYQQQLLLHLPTYHRGSVDSNSQQVPQNNSLSGIHLNNGSGFSELSPLTTVNSHTPSVSSVHSQQLSFFSAHQYLTRNSIDQSHPPSSNHRTSFDVYSKSRVSIDSLQSYNNFSINNSINTLNTGNNININGGNPGINMNGSTSKKHNKSNDTNAKGNNSNNNNTGFFGSSSSKRDRSVAPGRYTGFSFTNYIPFMSDKTSGHQRLDSGPSSPSSNSPPFGNQLRLTVQQQQQLQQLQQQQLQQQQQQQPEQQQFEQLQDKFDQQQEIQFQQIPNEFQNPPAQPSRHLIRSIFKNKNPALYPSADQADNKVSGSGNHNIDVVDEEGNYDGMDGLLGSVGNFNDGSAGGSNTMGQLGSQGNGIGLGPGLGDSMMMPGSDLDEKKPKKMKRSLFTRFKSLNPEEPQIKEENIDSMEERLIGDDHSSISLPSSTSNTAPQLWVDSTTLNSSYNNNVTSNGVNVSANVNTNEPDYAALFERVGKRKNIVNTSLFIKAKGKGVKVEQQQSLLRHSESDISSNLFDSVDNNSVENGSVQIKEEPNDEIPSGEMNIGSGNEQSNGTVSSTLANASKRILSSKLLKKKSMNATAAAAASATNSTAWLGFGSDENKVVGPEANRDSSLDLESSYTNNSSLSNNYNDNAREEIELGERSGTEVKINLKELDLPPTTQIFPTSIINSKSKTRGRKENKEADMLDLSKIFLCSYCSRRFKRQEHLKRHFRSLHTFEKPYDCPICQKKFSRSDNLNQHLKIHKQEEEMAAQGLTLNGEPLAELDEPNELENEKKMTMGDQEWTKI